MIEPGAIRIENNGTQPIIIILKSEDEFINTKVNPIEVAPNTSETLMLHNIQAFTVELK